MLSGLPRLTLPDRIITNFYAPLCGSEPLRVELSAPGADEVKHIMRRWEPFHRGESAADRLNNLYPTHASDAGSCLGHGSWRGLHGECSCRDPEGRHPTDYR